MCPQTRTPCHTWDFSQIYGRGRVGVMIRVRVGFMVRVRVRIRVRVGLGLEFDVPCMLIGNAVGITTSDAGYDQEDACCPVT